MLAIYCISRLASVRLILPMAILTALSQNAEEIHIHATSGIEPERTDKMLTRMGFETYGANYVAKLQ